MNTKLIKRIICYALIGISIVAIKPIKANAEWKQDNIGWWYTEGELYAKDGWRFINNKWYYFNDNGYMKNGWIQDNSKWYYLSQSGDMLSDTVTPDGYTLNADGSWNISISKIENKQMASTPISNTTIINNTDSNKTETIRNKHSSSSGSSSSSSSSSNNNDNVKKNVVSKVNLKVPTPIIGGTPKNIEVIEDNNYFIIVNQWKENEVGTSAYYEMKAGDKFKKGYEYEPVILLKAKYGYKFEKTWEWMTSRNIIINGENTMPKSEYKLSDNTILLINLYDISPMKSDIINTNVELNEYIDLSLDAYDSSIITEEDRTYMTIYYDEDTLDIKGMSTGKQGYQNDGYKFIYVDGNLENWCVMNNMNDYKLINDNGNLKVTKKGIDEYYVTVFYNPKNLRITAVAYGDTSSEGHISFGREDGEVVDIIDNGIVTSYKKLGYNSYSQCLKNIKEDYQINVDGKLIKIKDENLNMNLEVTTGSSVQIKE